MPPFQRLGGLFFSMVETRKIRPKAQFLKVCGHVLISCYEKRCHRMLFYFFNVCCLWWNGNTSRRSLCWQVTDCGSWSWQPAPPFWSAAELPPLHHIKSLPSPGCSSCSKKQKNLLCPQHFAASAMQTSGSLGKKISDLLWTKNQ